MYTTVGFSNWKKAPAAFYAHQISKAHNAALPCESLIPKFCSIGEMAVSELKKQSFGERLRYLAQQGIAICGDEDLMIT